MVAALPILFAVGASGAADAPPPYDILLIGEEHANPRYQEQIKNSLPDLLESGYTTFAMEQPEDLAPEVEKYIQGRVRFDQETQNEAMWNILSAINRVPKPNAESSRKTAVPGAERLASMLDLFVEAHCAGMKIQLPDVPTAQLGRHMDAVAVGDDGGGIDKTVDGVFRTLTARNIYMAQRLSPGTIVVVGRGHTGAGEGDASLEHYLRTRGFSVLSIDLVGADIGRHVADESSADISLTPEEVVGYGGLDGVARAMRGRGFEGKPKAGR